MSYAPVVLSEYGLSVPLPSGTAYFNYYWLRDACQSSIDPQTRERIFDISALTSAPKPQAARIEGAELVVEWQGGPLISRFSLDLLAAVSRDGHGGDPADIPRKLWYADYHPNMRRVTQEAVVNTPEGRAFLSRALIEDGIAIVTDMEASKESLFRLVNALGPVTPSAEGLSFEVRVEIAPTNLAFTARALEMHTDLPGEEAAPGVQFLHCLENTVEGGRSLYLDGAAVAAALKEEDPEAFDLLASHKIPFFYRHDKWDYRAHQRVIECDARGHVSGVTISQHLQDNIDLPQALLDSYYPALVKFIRMMKEDRFLCRFRSIAGQCVVFDNHRIVHGREAYAAESGKRHMRGCYMDRGAMRSTYRVLASSGYDGMQPADELEAIAS
ncbi:MAG: TauD/TfdA family dioxygenase [Allorhizobium sp.]